MEVSTERYLVEGQSITLDQLPKAESSLVHRMEKAANAIGMNSRTQLGGTKKCEKKYRPHRHMPGKFSYAVTQLPSRAARWGVTQFLRPFTAKRERPGKKDDLQYRKEFWKKRAFKKVKRAVLCPVGLVVGLIGLGVTGIGRLFTGWNRRKTVATINPDGVKNPKAQYAKPLGKVQSSNAEIRRFARYEKGVEGIFSKIFPKVEQARALSDHLPVQASFKFDNDQEFKMATMNLGLGPEYMSRACNDLEKPTKRAQWIANQVKDWNEAGTAPDVMCCQEVFDYPSADILINELKKQGYSHFIYPPADNDVGLNSGLFIASKFPIDPKESRYVPFEDGATADALANKGFVKVTLDVGNGEKMVIYNTHLQAQITSDNKKIDLNFTAIRKKQCEQIRQDIEDNKEIYKGMAGVFVGGDFNMAKVADDALKEGDESTKTPHEQLAFNKVFIEGNFATDPYQNTHDEHVRKAGTKEMYVEENLKIVRQNKEGNLGFEPTGSWHKGVNIAGSDFMGASWVEKQETVSGCCYDKILSVNLEILGKDE